MPVEVESSGQVAELLRVLRRRSAWILIPFAIISTLGIAFAIVVPKKYVAKTRVMVREVVNRDGQRMVGGREGGKVATYLIRSPSRIEGVIEDLNWPFRELTRTEREDLVTKVMDNLSVEAPNMGIGLTQQLVAISYADTDPRRAFEFLSEVSRTWQDEVLESSRKAKEKAFATLTGTRREMEQELQDIRIKITDLMQTHNIPPLAIDRFGQRTLAPEFDELEALEAKNAELEEKVAEADLALKVQRKRYELMEDEIPIQATTEGQDFAKEIADRETQILGLRFELKQQGYRSGHSRYDQIMEEIAKLEEMIDLLRESETTTTTETGMVANPDKLLLANEIDSAALALERDEERLEQLRLQIIETETRTKELASVYQEIHGLQDKRNRVNAALTDADSEHEAMGLEIQELTSSAGDPFMVLEDPKLPVRPTQPDPLLIIAFSILASLTLGFGSAILLEYSKSCFRSVNDITRVMVVPVLGTVNAIVTRSERRRRLVATAVLAGSTLAFVLVVGYVTWAWSYKPSLLSDGLRESIDNFRSSLE